MEPEKQVNLPERFVMKKSGIMEVQDLKKLRKRLDNLLEGLNMDYIKPNYIVQQMKQNMHNGITTTEIDKLLAETCAYLNMLHPDYSKLAARVCVSELHKNTKENFADFVEDLKNYKDLAGRPAPLISQDCYDIIQGNAEKIQAVIDYSRDFEYDFFGYKTLERAYLLRIDNKIAERPQALIMRVSIGIHKEDLEAAFETYNLMSSRWFTHATPTLFNAGTCKPQCSSCFLLTVKDDSLEGIYNTLFDCAMISKSAGGIGVSIHKIRASGSYIKGTNGYSNGIVPMLRVFNDTARYVDQGGGKRKGSIAIYLEPWHADINDFLELKKNFGAEENRARDLFYALWIPDLFLKRVEEDGDWTLMCPCECPGLPDCHGEEFVKLYESYEKAGRGRKTIKARTLWKEIIATQIETGTPYFLYKDAANSKSNQQHLGTIRSSNLCTEIIEYTAPDEVAVCNLASICLPMFVKDGKFDYENLIKITGVVTRNLNKIIDLNYYPIPEAKYSNLKHRPIGIGVQGFADVMIKMRLPLESKEALALNEKIFAALYYGALVASLELAKKDGPYETFPGSPTSKGLLQFDLWNKEGHKDFDWKTLKEGIVKHGLKNSLFIAPMPTASTAQIMGNTEGLDPITANIYNRRTLSGEFICTNKYLVQDLIKLGLWTTKMKNKLIAQNGSVQGIQSIPDNIKELYKTVWEISQKSILQLSASRAPYIDQSQSLNIHMEQANYSKVSSMHFYAWKLGLKTGMYYLRSRPAVDPIKFTIDMEEVLKENVNGNNNTNMNHFNQIQKKRTKKVKVKVKVRVKRRRSKPLGELAGENTVQPEVQKKIKSGKVLVDDDTEIIEKEIEIEQVVVEKKKEEPKNTVQEDNQKNNTYFIEPCFSCGS